MNNYKIFIYRQIGQNSVKEIEFEESITQNAKCRTYKELEKLSDLNNGKYYAVLYVLHSEKWEKVIEMPYISFEIWDKKYKLTVSKLDFCK